MCRGVTVLNDNGCDSSAAYASGRGRVFRYWATFFQTWGLSEMETGAGLYRLRCASGARGAVVAPGYRAGECVVEHVAPVAAEGRP